MDLFVFSDESGVFDYLHNRYFVFAGVICFGKSQKDDLSRKFKHFEATIRSNRGFDSQAELKASLLSNIDKGKAFRSLNSALKFCVVIDENALNKSVFDHKKHKQRYLDYAYKLVLKKLFCELLKRRVINAGDIENIRVFADEHSTATDGRYELRENLLNEFKIGTFNFEYNLFFEPIFPELTDLTVNFCDSSKVTLIRAAENIANRCYHQAMSNNGKVEHKEKLFVLYLPSNQIDEFELPIDSNPQSNPL